MTECAKLHPSYRHPKGFKKARVFFVTCSSVPDVGGFSASPINPVQRTHSLAVWKELGIKIKIIRCTSESAVVIQWLSRPLTNTRAALPVRNIFLQQPHSLIHFPSLFPNIQISSRGEQCMLCGLFPKQVSKALPAFCRAGRP